MIVRGRCRVPPPPLHCWQPADLRGWLFGVALCTRRRRPHCVKEKRREAILVLSPTEALRKRTEAPHGFACMGQRLLCFSVCKLRHQQRISKGMAQRNRKWPNRHTRSLGHLQKWRSNQDRGTGWAFGELRQHQVSFVPLAPCPPPWQNKPPPPWHFVFSEDLTAPPAAAAQRCTNMFTDVQVCSKMYKVVQRRKRCLKMYKGPS